MQKRSITNAITRYIKKSRYVSISSIQRNFKINFTAAKTLLNQSISNNVQLANCYCPRSEILQLDVNDVLHAMTGIASTASTRIQIISEESSGLKKTQDVISKLLSHASFLSDLNYADGVIIVFIARSDTFFGRDLKKILKAIKKYTSKHCFFSIGVQSALENEGDILRVKIISSAWE